MVERNVRSGMTRDFEHRPAVKPVNFPPSLTVFVNGRFAENKYDSLTVLCMSSGVRGTPISVISDRKNPPAGRYTTGPE